jgi:hypothetical protein
LRDRLPVGLGLGVGLRGPSVFITKMSTPLGLSAMKAIFDPSGDQAGFSSDRLGELVAFVRPLPLAFITKISLFPVRVEKNASLAPFGAQAGSESKKLSLVRAARFEPLGSIVQMSGELPRA